MMEILLIEYSSHISQAKQILVDIFYAYYLSTSTSTILNTSVACDLTFGTDFLNT